MPPTNGPQIQRSCGFRISRGCAATHSIHDPGVAVNRGRREGMVAAKALCEGRWQQVNCRTGCLSTPRSAVRSSPSRRAEIGYRSPKPTSRSPAAGYGAAAERRGRRPHARAHGGEAAVTPGVEAYRGIGSLLERMRDIGMWAEVQVQHDELVSMRPLLADSGARIVFDHCGPRSPVTGRRVTPISANCAGRPSAAGAETAIQSCRWAHELWSAHAFLRCGQLRLDILPAGHSSRRPSAWALREASSAM